MASSETWSAASGESPWCDRCGTRHHIGDECPGPLLATGPERHGWRARIGTWNGPRIFGIVVAPVGSRWRARILTFPEALWLVPHGTVSMKFVGDTPSAAETQAIDYIRRHCAERKYAIGDVLPPARPGNIPEERSPNCQITAADRRSTRKLHAMRIRFGEASPVHDGMTHDLSEEGLFIVSEQLIKQQKRIHMVLEIDGLETKLLGVVRWSRISQAQGRPKGMGVALEDAPGIYRHYVRRLP